MAERINPSELFGKGNSDNLSEKSLKKAAKKKKNLMELIESNLPYLVEYYFGGKVEKKYLNYIYRLCGSEKYFLAPLKRLARGKHKGDVPKGMHVIMVDSVDKVRSLFNQKIAQIENQTKDNRSDIRNDYIDKLKEKCNEQEAEILAIATSLVRKERRAFEDLGMERQFAEMLALAMVPKKFMNEHNVARYIHRLNMTLMRIMTLGMSKDVSDEGEERFINTIGVNLADQDVLNAIYGMFLQGVSRKVYLKALLGVLLERRSKANQYFTKPQKAIYNAISNLVTDTLEGTNVINYTGGKLKKKEAKELVIDKKERKKVMTEYSKERVRDMRKGNDSTRRIIFKALAEDAYPNLLKEFHRSNSDAITEDFEGSHDLQQPEDEKPKQQNNNKNNNRNSHQEGKDNRNSRKK